MGLLINYGPFLPHKAIFFGIYDQVNLCWVVEKIKKGQQQGDSND